MYHSIHIIQRIRPVKIEVMEIGASRLNRRRFIGFGAGAGFLFGNLPFAFGAADFWNKKEPAEWSSSDIHLLTTRSPWAKEIRIEDRSKAGNSYDGSAPVGSNLPGDPNSSMRSTGIAGVPQSQAASQASMQRAPTQYEIGQATRDAGHRPIPTEAGAATVRWESARPVLDATGIPLPTGFRGHYVVGVSGLQFSPAQRPGMLELLKGAAFLEKGKERAQPGIAEYSKDGATIFFGFSRELFPLTNADKEVQFEINTGELRIRAKFELKEMVYRGQLAL